MKKQIWVSLLATMLFSISQFAGAGNNIPAGPSRCVQPLSLCNQEISRQQYTAPAAASMHLPLIMHVEL